MTTEQSRRAGRVAGLTGAFAGLVFGLLSAATPDRAAVAASPNAQKDDKKEYAKPPEGDLELVGAAECQKCHQENDASKVKLYQETKGFEFIRLWENKVWDAHDLHKTAYVNLLTSQCPEVKDGTNKANATAQKMEDNLRGAGGDKKYRDAKYTVASDTQCLACHASTLKPPNQDIHKNWKADAFLTSDGVGCEMCHGLGSKYRDEHQKSKIGKSETVPGAIRTVPWREWPATGKKEWGLVNLRDGAEATARCASCHIGNTDEGRFVTHDMYAAGHPPLPPLDLIAYTREQPRHWGLPSEMPYLKNLAEKYPNKAETVFHIRAGESHVARRFVESTIATLRSSVTLGGQLAKEAKDNVAKNKDKKGMDKKNEGLDYAAFDCASCHHNLKYPSDRQDRGYLGKPGRPLYRPATFALTKLVIAHAASMEPALTDSFKQLLAAEKKLADAFTSNSLGDPDLVIVATGELVKWTEDAMLKLAAVKYTPQAVQGLLAKLTEAANLEPKNPDPTKRPVADPEVAQLYTWAAETLLLDLIEPTKVKEKDGEKERMKLIPPKEVAQLRDSLKGIVVTRLRPDALFHYEVEGGVPGPNVQPVDERIGKRMEIFNSFQGVPFRKAFSDLKPTFPK